MDLTGGCLGLGTDRRAAEIASEQRLFECRLRPMMHSWLADAENFRLPPLVSGAVNGPSRTLVHCAANGRKEPMLNDTATRTYGGEPMEADNTADRSS